jgi:hypothetical protein
MLSYILTSCHQFLYMVLICFVKIYVNLDCSCFFTSVKYKMCMTRHKSYCMLIELTIDSENQLYKGLDIFVTLHFFEELEVWVFSCELQFMFLSRCNARASFLVCKKKVAKLFLEMDDVCIFLRTCFLLVHLAIWFKLCASVLMLCMRAGATSTLLSASLRVATRILLYG